MTLPKRKFTDYSSNRIQKNRCITKFQCVQIFCIEKKLTSFLVFRRNSFVQQHVWRLDEENSIEKIAEGSFQKSNILNFVFEVHSSGWQMHSCGRNAHMRVFQIEDFSEKK